MAKRLPRIRVMLQVFKRDVVSNDENDEIQLGQPMVLVLSRTIEMQPELADALVKKISEALPVERKDETSLSNTIRLS